MSHTPTFILADNQDVTRSGLLHYVTTLFSGSVTIPVADKSQLMSVLDECGSGIVVLDYTLFDFQGIDDFLNLLNRFSEATWLLFSAELSEGFIRRLSFEHRISMVLKECSGDEITSALRCAVVGERFLCHQVTNLLVSTPESFAKPLLTASETEVLRLIAQGKSVKEIAAERNSSIHTITTHKKNIFRKLQINSVYEATKYALRAGLLEMVEYYI